MPKLSAVSPPHPATRAGPSRSGVTSAFRVLQSLDRDPVHALEREASRGVEEVGELPRCGDQGGGDVQGGDEVFVEELRVADDLAVVEDGIAEVVRIGGETEAEALGDAGEDGTGEERVFSAVEDGGGDGAGALFVGGGPPSGLSALSDKARCATGRRSRLRRR